MPGEAAPADVPLAELVRQALRDDIVSGQLRPGERIVQDSVAKRFRTSRIPVREALPHLASEGLVTLAPDGLPRLRRVIDSLADTTTQYRRVCSLLPGRLAISHAGHRLLIDAFERRARTTRPPCTGCTPAGPGTR